MCGDIFDTMNGEGAAAVRAEGPRMLSEDPAMQVSVPRTRGCADQPAPW